MVESTSVTSQFRAKVAEMRAWKPENPPSVSHEDEKS